MEEGERAQGHPGVTENLVARLWEEQRGFALPLATLDGREIRVV